ncbi:unnamed protein product [Owenia fusiformis]|uniref:Uncharacterized protein n=1 Tax=Owenia fusiformis TaxID=6347 RepID=A0A8J1XPB9_OWEFU|nr:unnamed protein product [Owenia fusiformis]
MVNMKLRLVILYITCTLAGTSAQSRSTHIGISLSKYQCKNETYFKFPHAEVLENPLKAFKVRTHTRCRASCSVIPDECKSYNLRKIEGEKHIKMCELLGPYLTIEAPTATPDDVDHYLREIPVECRENEQLISGDRFYVADSGLTASTTHSSSHGTQRSRLDTQAGGGQTGAWSVGTNNINQWIQADLGEVRVVAGVVTQGRQDMGQWVKSYKFIYGETENDLEEYGMVLPEVLENPLKAFKVLTNTRCEASCSVIPDECKSYNLRKIEGEKHMKMCELLGPYLTVEYPTATLDDVDHYLREALVECRENKQMISGDDFYVADAGITASTTHSHSHGTQRSRLDTQADGGGTGAWCVGTRDIHQWIQADLGEIVIVTGVVTQGRQAGGQWVKSYKFIYGETENDLEEYGMVRE